MQDKMLYIKNQLCFPLYAAAKEVVNKYKPLLDELDITYTQYITLLVLWEHKILSVKELGDYLYLDSGTLTPLLKRMEGKSLIKRARSDNDERNVIITLTQNGEKLKERALALPVKVRQCINLTDTEAITLYNLLYKILDKNLQN